MAIDRAQIPPLYTLSPNRRGIDLRDCIRRLIEGGARWIQIREKWCSDREVIGIVRSIVDSAHRNVHLFVNDRVDLAIGSRAAGVHLGDRDLPPDVASEVADGRDLMIGVSTHSVEEAVEMSRRPSVDYVAIGPIFESPTKMVREPLGLVAIERLRSKIDSPIVAIGGIDRTNIRATIAAGADSAAVISALYESDRIEDNVRELLERAQSR